MFQKAENGKKILNGGVTTKLSSGSLRESTYHRKPEPVLIFISNDLNLSSFCIAYHWWTFFSSYSMFNICSCRINYFMYFSCHGTTQKQTTCCPMYHRVHIIYNAAVWYNMSYGLLKFVVDTKKSLDIYNSFISHLLLWGTVIIGI